MPVYSSDDDMDHQQQPRAGGRSSGGLMGLFSRQRSLRSVIGNGKVAEILLWRDKIQSGSILAGFTMTWFLLEVADLSFITIACYILMTLMIGLLGWTLGADIIRRRPPSFSDIQISEYTVRYMVDKTNRLLARLYMISRGDDLPRFFAVLAVLWIVSIVGCYSSTLNLIYICYLILATVPALYERYEREVDYLATQGNRDMRRLYNQIDSKVLSKIPRGPVKSKKYR